MKTPGIWWMGPAGLAVAGALALAAYASRPGVPTGRPAPAVSYTLLDGRGASLAQSRGKVVLLNFWSIDCAPCLREMPQLAQTYRRYRDRGFETLAVAQREDPPAAVIDYARTRELPFEVVIDIAGTVRDRFGPMPFTPTSVLIDRQGRMVERYVGALDFAALDARIDALLGAP